jgi:abortive infection bacteriophage resistance protein
MTKESFGKQPLNTEELIKKLIDRGLIITNRNEARHYIEHIGYFRLTGYCIAFQTKTPEPHIFKTGTTFDQIINCYRFDRELRMLILDAIERIEVSLKASLSNYLSLIEPNAFWFTDKNYFEPDNTKKKWSHSTLLNTIKNRVKEKSSSPFLKKYLSKYNQDWPPSWMVMEVMTIG